MNNLSPKTIGIIIAALLLAYALKDLLFPTKKKHRCMGCGKNTTEWVRLEKASVFLCREHLVGMFRENFLRHRGKKFVSHPSLEDKNKEYQYSATNFAEFKQYFQRTEDDLVKVQRALDEIHGKCTNCGNKASVAFFDRHCMSWYFEGNDAQIPNLSELNTAKVELLCDNCTLNRIEPSLLNFKGQFTSGVYLAEEADAENDLIYLSYLI